MLKKKSKITFFEWVIALNFWYLQIIIYMKKHNFSAGPAVLPQEVIEGAAQAILELDNIGLSLIDISTWVI